jgi:acetyltransferase-like isoleucine patch superfamily enzyme
MARALLGPVFLFGFVVLVWYLLDILLGPLRPSPARGRGQIDKWRMSLMHTLMPTETLSSFTELFGQHYEATSVTIRALGGTVGKRVYWPGVGPEVHGDYHLLSVGDDVVFGSRSHLVTSDGVGAERVTIEDRVMVADRVVLLPGSTVGTGAVMGSGALGRRGKYYSAHGRFVGSKGGDSVCLLGGLSGAMPADKVGTNHSEPTSLVSAVSSARPSLWRTNEKEKGRASRPFGRAFYEGLAPYHVLGQLAIACYSSLAVVLVVAYWDTPSIVAIQVAERVLRQQGRLLTSDWRDPLHVYALLTVCTAAFITVQTILAVTVIVTAKWMLLGRRQAGNYDWDRSSYCQRWHLLLAIERLRPALLPRLWHTGYAERDLVLRAVLPPSRGVHWKGLCIFAGGPPSLVFTEPDLLSLGDRVVVDDASLVCHVNTEGRFDLNPLEVGDRCVLRTGSRLAPGARMLNDACLFEHTLVMGGDVVSSGERVQGWPGDVFRGSRLAAGNG